MYLLHELEYVPLVYQICQEDYIFMWVRWSDLEILEAKPFPN